MVQAKNKPATEDDTLSALADGQALPHEVAAACQAWRDDERQRERWHAYHLIGDSLRSQELASAPQRDEAFLAALRQRLAAEPVVLAPAAAAPAATPARRRMGWQAPAAVAAGFVAVAGVLTVARMPGGVNPGGDAKQLAITQPMPVVRVGTAPAPVAAAPVAAPQASTMMVIRDPRLDRYLAVHRGLANGLAAPGTGVQQVEVLQPLPK
ncbi:negative regulator of sigma E activity [Burkholderiales bacterium JOSHI_001]|nr:negative regulator of sigma E activity [Burkholderiales bacterium JOSHI_001]